MAKTALYLADVQGLVVFRRPAPYWGSFALIRVDQAEHGRRLLRHLLPQIISAAQWADGHRDISIAVALTHPGLAALGLSAAALQSFPVQLRDGMAARADRLGDVGHSAPAHWQPPFGTGDVHIVVAITAATQQLWQQRLAEALAGIDKTGLAVLDRFDVAAQPGMRTTLGYRDGISFPNIAGFPPSPITNPEPPLATGEFLLGHPSESGTPLAAPTPSWLGHNGTYLGLRKIHTRVAAYRKFLRDNAPDRATQELLAAKLVGRWRSGTPLMLAPDEDDPSIAADPERVNNFGYAADPDGRVCPRGAHIRRVNPRNSRLATLTDVRNHRILRFGAVYGDALPEDAPDDGADRGIYFMFLSARPHALEFIKGDWVNDGGFLGLGSEKDPVDGANDGSGIYTLPGQPIRRRLHGIDRFTITRGGEYTFLPSLTALEHLARP